MSELMTEISILIRGRNMSKVRWYLEQHFRVNSFNKLSLEELEEALEVLESAVSRGDL